MQDRRGAADLILENADIITGGPAVPETDALAVRDDRIMLIGSRRDVEAVRKRSTRVIDCGGKTLAPGFNDAHCHFFALARRLSSLDLSPAAVRSIEDIREAVRQKAQNSPPGSWIRGAGYNEFYLAEKRHPTRQDLDAAAPNHPVMISHRSLHACVLNSLALQLAGITGETEEPLGGIIERDLTTGEPNGILYEMETFVRSRVSLPMTETELDQAVREVNRQYLSLGITSIGEAAVTNDINQWQTYRRLKSAGRINSRIYFMPGADFLHEFREAGLTTGAGDEGLRVGSLKIILSMAEGQLQPSQEELNQLIVEAGHAGFQVAIHAIEQNAVLSAVKALEYAGEHLPPSDRRHRIEHCSECPPELCARLSRQKAVVVSQPPFVYYHGERYLADVPEETQPWLYPFRSLLDAGIVVAGSSDSPVVPLNPMHGIYAAVTRRAESGQTLSPEEKISIRQALDMYTRNGAFASFEENIKGSLAPGMLADIVMLSSNPLKAAEEDLKDISVEMTLVGGKIVWSA